MRLRMLAMIVFLPLLATGCGGRTGSGGNVSAPASRTSSPAPALTGSGIDLPSGRIAFGDALAKVRPALEEALGKAREDGPLNQLDPECTATGLRVLGYSGGSLRLFFDPADADAFTGWKLMGRGRVGGLPPARAVVDGAPVMFGPGSTVAELRARLGSAFTTSELEEGGPAFSYDGVDGRINGFLSAQTPDGVVGVLQGGGGCDA